MTLKTFNVGAARRTLARSIQASPHPGRLMRTLCREIGPRPPGSAAMRQAQNFLRREWMGFEAANVQPEPVLLDGWKPGLAAVRMIAPFDRRFEGIQAIHSSSGTVCAPLIDGGTLAFADVQRLGEHAREAILMVDGHQISGGSFEPVQKRISLAEALGAAAVLLAGWHPVRPSIQFLNRARLPVISVAGATARKLRQLLRTKAVRLRLETAGQTRRVSCRNLIGELGPRHATELLIACAHLDGFHLAPAALDNLSGVVTMTEIARVLAPYQRHFRRRLRFIAFTGEEHGFAGSKAYVRAHEAELDRTRFVFSLDCLFDSTARGVAVMGAPRWRAYIVTSLGRSPPRVEVRNRFCMSSDYLPFLLAGVPAARPADWHDSFPSWTHTVLDTEARVPARWLKANATVGASILLRMLTDPKPLPSRRKRAAEVQELIRRENAAEALRWQVLLPS